MKRFTLALSFLTLLLLPGTSQAAFTDFEDLTLSIDSGAILLAGDTIHSQGIDIDLVEFMSVGGNANVTIYPVELPGLSGKIVGTGNLAFNFSIPADTHFVSLYYDNNSGVGLFINAVEVPAVSPLTSLDGATVAGVDIAVDLLPHPFASETGILTLTGPISSFAIGGFELAIDNVTIDVPEPTTASLALIALGCLGLRLRSRK